MIAYSDSDFIKTVLEQNFTSQEKIDLCSAAQNTSLKKRGIGDIMLEKGIINQANDV